jgi:hypothetical protein
MLKILDAVFSLIPGDGYKRIVLYILTQIPLVTEHPPLVDALSRFVMNPSKETGIDVALQLGLAFAMLHGGIKLVTRK